MARFFASCKALHAFGLLLLLVTFSGSSHATLNILGAAPDTSSPVTVAVGATVPATVLVLRTDVSNLSNDQRWRCTRWRISTSPTSGGTTAAVDHANYDSVGLSTINFNMTAPTTPGTYNVYYIAYNNDGCGSGASPTYIGVSAIVVTPAPPVVSSIVRASTNPTVPNASVSWTVTFSKSVTGVDAGDFSLVQSGGATGASITSVSGSGTTWTVTANTGTGYGTLGLDLVDNDSIVDSASSGNRLGGAGTGNGNFTGETYSIQTAFCSPPPGAPSGLTCVCDTFGRSALNPSTIFGGNWALSNSDGISNPSINSTTGRLRLTENTANNAKAATVPGIFPAAGNYISVEFNHYAYNGSGADGIAVTLSDYVVPAVPGGYGGSLGYAQNTSASPSKPGFAGGWVGIALDEYGNYQNPTEGRVLGPGLRADSVGVRGPGNGYSGYRWLGGTGANQNIDVSGSTPGPGYMYQVIVDARNSASGTINVSVNRDTTTRNGNSYVPLFGPFNAYNEAAYALGQGWISQLIPDYWKISFTGSTGGSNNIHEIGSLRICAQSVYPSTGGIASGFSAIDEAYPAAAGSSVPAYQNFQTGDIYMKLAGVPFKLWVAALTNTGMSTAYAVGGNKFVSVKLVDNNDGVCGTDASRTCNSACVGKPAVETGGSQIMTYTSSDPGAKLSSNFTLNSAYKNLIAVMRECTSSSCGAFTSTAAACSVDSFSVRPTAVTSLTSPNATGAAVFKAGGDNFTLTATTVNAAGSNATGYTGQLKIANGAVKAVSPATASGQVTPNQFGSAAASGIATTSNFTYSEVGAFRILQLDPTSAETDSNKIPRGVYDGVVSGECGTAAACDTLRAATWTGIDSVSTENDCIANSFSNTKDSSGRYGCNFGLAAQSNDFGRFIPNHFEISESKIVNRSDTTCTPAASAFTYMGEPFRVEFKLTAKNASNAATLNYTTGVHARFAPTSWHALGSNNSFGLWATASEYALGDDVCDVFFSTTTPSATTFDCSGVANPAAIARAAGPRVAVTSSLPTPAWNNGVASFAANVILHRADQPDGAYAKLKIGIAPRDADGVGVALGAMDEKDKMDADNDGDQERALVGSTDVRYGRLLIPNVYGSHLLPLPVTVQAQYWNGPTGTYIFNGADSCTSLAAGNFSLTQGSGSTIATSLAGSSVMKNGTGILTLNKPTSVPTGNGSLVLSTSTTSPAGLPLNSYLPGKGVETFGIYKSGPVIYFRERY
ncbi:DUF6701 domain-containing protein [Paucimonas lemoignei]|nr:DUF6701 domain-containing protein [Paucimonas lemoignei]